MEKKKDQKTMTKALAGIPQCIEHGPVNWRVTGSIPSWGLGCRLGPQWGAWERQPHIDVSLPLSLPSPLSKNKYINNLLKNNNKVSFWSETNRIELKLSLMVIKSWKLIRRNKLEKDENILPFRVHQVALSGEMSGADMREQFKCTAKENI